MVEQQLEVMWQAIIIIKLIIILCILRTWKRSCMLTKGMHIAKLGNFSWVIVDLKYGQLIALSFEWNQLH